MLTSFQFTDRSPGNVWVSTRYGTLNDCATQTGVLHSVPAGATAVRRPGARSPQRAHSSRASSAQNTKCVLRPVEHIRQGGQVPAGKLCGKHHDQVVHPAKQGHPGGVVNVYSTEAQKNATGR